MSIYTIIFIIFTALMIVLNYKTRSKRLTHQEIKAQRIQEQDDKKQRAIDRMPRFGYYIYHIAPKGTPLDEGFIGMTNTLDEYKEYLFTSLKSGKHNNKILQKAWIDFAFTEQDFHIIHENLSGRKACERMVELRSQNYMGWNEAIGGWAWNNSLFRD
ncbi:hypothetical protein [Marinicellulosiphila megalodicopiae]|uniref:hypothetical protein n=1 Tax=Marinicellulosiphila megalodicopiae TaxID=2724896 RepID=UPI003BB2194E